MTLAFDSSFYQSQRPDVYNAFIATAGSTGQTWAEFAQAHYNTFGRFEGSDPSASFSTNYYLSTYPDIAAAGVNPFDHFLANGSLEMRQPYSTFPTSSFVAADYAAANPDLAAAGITSDAALYQHWVIHGQFESRSGAPEVTTPNSGESFTLTTGVDAFTGTTGDDTFTGGALAPDGVTAATTLNPLDSLNGGDGVDTLVLDTTGNQNQTIQGTITNIENLTFAGGGATIPTVDATMFSGAITWQQTTDTAFAVTGATGQTFHLDRVADTTTATVGFGAAQASTTLNVSSPVGDATFSVSGTGLTTINSNISGSTATGKSISIVDTGNTTTGFSLNTDAANTVTINSGGLKTVTVAGGGKVSLTTTTAPTTSVDASGNTGGLTLVTALAAGASFTGGSGADTLTNGASTAAVATGAGDDNVTWTVAALGTGGSSDGGDGTDTLNLTAANIATATSSTALGNAFAASISNFEKIGVGATAAATAIDADHLDGITNIQSAGTVGANTLTINDMAANSTFGMSALAAAAVTLNLKDSSGSADVLNLEFSATNGFVNTAAIVAAGVETINITTDDTDTVAATTAFTVPITAVAAKSVTVTGDAGINLTGLTATTLTTLDASGVTATGAGGAVTLTTGALAAASTLSGGAGNDTLNAAAAVEAVTLNGNGGNDALTGSSTKANTINGGDGNDTIVGGTGVDTVNGGAGTDSIASSTGLDMLTGGAGNDTFTFVVNANGNTYSTVTDAAAGDILTLVDQGAETFTTAAISLAPTAAFQDYLDAATAGDGSVNGAIAWFQYSGDTYVVEDLAAANTFQNGTDLVVKLTGLVDVSTAGQAGNVLTLA